MCAKPRAHARYEYGQCDDTRMYSYPTADVKKYVM